MYHVLEARVRAALAAHIQQVLRPGCRRRHGTASSHRDGRNRHARLLRAGQAPEARAPANRAGNRRATAGDRRRRARGSCGRGLCESLFRRAPHFSRPPWTERGIRAGSRRAGRAQMHRRAHQHQSQQGRAHRPPAQRRAGRHAGARAAPRRDGAWKCRITSTTPACRSPMWSSPLFTSRRNRPRKCARWPRSRSSIISAGTSTRASRNFSRKTRRGSRLRGETLEIHRGRPRRGGGNGRHRRSRRRSLPPAHDGAPGHRIRSAAPRKRNPAPEILGRGVRAAEAAQRHSSRRHREKMPAAG